MEVVVAIMHRGAVANVRRSGGKVSSIEVTAEEMKKKKKLVVIIFFISVMKNLLFGNLRFHGKKILVTVKTKLGNCILLFGTNF